MTKEEHKIEPITRTIEDHSVAYYMARFDEVCEEWHEKQIAKQAYAKGYVEGLIKSIIESIIDRAKGKAKAKIEMLIDSIKQKQIPHEMLLIFFSPTFNDQQISLAEKYISEHRDASDQLIMEEISKLLGESTQTHVTEG
ncbi:hypothetical protein phytr_2040 [Candidatus Phycorickettsia trachydisci]|uniref:Uncharacterized protein n=1 Tax=Candidatus Phycorickettsia trachydisci TaxID=2115978 RepID=A0A2P1P7B4_9RICK|nr:hypothetical protein [Candidatus Phycorickettsia trachydisci]AVP87162.1 hypothetical protein phytr_2040 [Candidatus Phycorickettsia trachydisci]